MHPSNHYVDQYQVALNLAKHGIFDEAVATIASIEKKEIAKLPVVIEIASLAEKAKQQAHAAKIYQFAYALQPSNKIRRSVIVNYFSAGEYDAAEDEARQAVKKSPKDGDFWNLLGVILKAKKRYKESIEALNQAAKWDPKSVSPWVNLGNVYHAMHEPAKAIEPYVKAIKIAPNNAENTRLLGRTYKALGQYEKAINTLNNALKIDPNHIETRAEIVAVLFETGQFQLALEGNMELIKLQPNQLKHIRNRGIILKNVGRKDDAIELFKAILDKTPEDVETVIELGKMYCFYLNDRKSANELYEKAYELFPDNIELAGSYCTSLTNSRYGDESTHFTKAYEVALRLLNNDPALLLPVAHELQSILLRAVDYENLDKLGNRNRLLKYWVDTGNLSALHNQLGRVVTLQDRLDLVKFHQESGNKLQIAADKNPITRSPKPEKRDKVRIGLMSSDLRHHPVTYFIQPILEQFDRKNFEIYCYSFYPGDVDAVQKRISEVVTSFKVLPNLTHQQIAQEIYNDDLDILFELGGNTLHNKVQVCAYRPAPIQVSWLGYPHSAGIANIDYLLVDPYLKPEVDGLILEKPFELSETWVTLGNLGFNEIPIDSVIPEKRQGCITFGTANNPYKYTRETFAAWAQVLLQVENSKFLFLRPEGGVQAFRDNVCKIFNTHGISSDRIVFVPVRGTHMQHYNQIDITLDPFPHVGGTTTCESLWMGVPVVTLIGQSFFERISYSNLANAGLIELCAHTVDDYVKAAVNLAKDQAKREHLRTHLRAQISENPLGQAERFVRNFEAQVLKVINEHQQVQA